MERKSVVVGVVIGIVIGMLFVGGPLGAMAVIDELNSVDTPEVTVDRLNSSHAAVAWRTEEPAHGHLETLVQPGCNSSWIAVNDVNASFGRMHTVVAPIYELNDTKVNQTYAEHADEEWFEHEGESPKRFKVRASVYKDGSGAGKTIFTRNLSSDCQ